MKRMLLNRYALLCCFLLLSVAAMAQTGSISGRVTDATAQPLPGATVIVKGTTQNAITNPEGRFTLNGINNGPVTLEIRFIGYLTQEKQVNVSGSTTADIVLQDDTKGLNEVVVIGYGTQKKKDLTGAITTISTKDFNVGPITNPEQLINGKVAGLQITSGGGAPGAASRIRIRGGASLNASNDPLFVVDGVPLDNTELKGASSALSLINPNDIESFNVLKDASATAIYGSRASNGVIIITTKKGAKGEALHLNFNTQASLSARTGQVDVLTGDQLRQLVKEKGSPEQQALLGTANTDWQKAITQDAFSTDNNLSVSGGIKALPYRFSVGYTGQDGIVRTSNMKRTTASLSLSPRFFDDHLKVDLNVRGTYTKSRFADVGAINAAVAFDPTQPIYGAKDKFGGYFEWLDNSGNPNTLATRNPLALLELKDDRGEVKRSIGNIQLDYKFHFLPELRANLNLGYDVSSSEGGTQIPAYAGSVFARGGTKSQYSQKKNNKLMDFYLNYVKDLKNIDSRLDVMAGYSYQDFIREAPSYADLNQKGDTISQAGLPAWTQNTLISFFGRLNYTFKDKYLLTATFRRDGSSRFKQHWSNFPSAALAWKVKEESFLKNSKVLSDLKLRVGYGLTGQQDVLNDYPYLPRYTLSDPTAQYPFGGIYYLTLRPEGYDSNIKWEETQTYNAGIDFAFLGGKLSGSVDYYFKKTKDLLSIIPVAAGSNLTNFILTNVGNIENKGLEIVINANPVSTKRFNWNLGFNATFNRTRITNLSKVKDDNSQGILTGTVTGGNGNQVEIHSVGYAPYSYYVYKQVYDNNGKPVDGKYEDLNGDGQITPEDRYRYKSPDPKVLLGFNSQFTYDKWNLGFVLRANLGNYLYNNVSSDNGAYRNFQYPNYLANVHSSIYKTGFTTNQYFSDYYVENASFLRMDNISLGYDFGKILRNKVTLRVNANVQNVFVITGYSGLDPEIGFAGKETQTVGIDDRFYPRPRVYSLGLNLGF